MKVLILDNYDSFTYNLYHYSAQFAEEVLVRRNDEITLDEISIFDKIVLSPGPGLPSDAGILMDVIEQYGNSKPILGVCLGLQGIVEHFGGSLRNLSEVLHGKESKIHLKKPHYLFDKIPDHSTIGHYHSWVVAEEDVPEELEIIALNEKGLIMAMAHKKWDICGVQFHPESILTTHGLRMIENWILE